MNETPSHPETEKDGKWVRYSRSISVSPYLRGPPILPGKRFSPPLKFSRVWAATVLDRRPGVDVTAMQRAAFDRFLEIGENDQCNQGFS